MKTLFLNLPHKDRIVRRYICSYNSPAHLFPPYELLQLASCVRAWTGAEVSFIDAIAQGKNETGLSVYIRRTKPDVVISMAGLESIAADLSCIDRLKSDNPQASFVVFGHYPTIFSAEILEKSRLDVILRGEPEEGLSAYLSARKNKQDITVIPAIALRGANGNIIVNEPKRITDLDNMPFCDYSLVRAKDYSEMLLGGPLGVIQSARGCPFLCNYCVTSYGRRLISKSAERVIQELRHLVAQGLRVVRFIDDTFTVDKKRVEKICEGISREKLKLRWSCLSRVDTLDKQMLSVMKRAGCVRVYVGVESYSQPVLDYLGKGYDSGRINEALELVRGAGLESVGFVIIGTPVEGAADFSQTLEGLLRSPLDLVIATKFTPYPGTPMFEKLKNKVKFNLIPYECRLIERAKDLQAIGLERRLYRRFYFRPAQMARLARIVFRSPFLAVRVFVSFMAFILRPHNEKEHPDFL